MIYRTMSGVLGPCGLGINAPKPYRESARFRKGFRKGSAGVSAPFGDLCEYERFCQDSTSR
jgi:hypothetical protein